MDYLHMVHASEWEETIFHIYILKNQSIRAKSTGDTRSWTTDLSICSRMLYHWAISPHIDYQEIYCNH